MKIKNVLVVIQTSAFGGPHNQVLQLSGLLQENGYRYIALLPEERGNAHERLESAGIKVIRTPYHRIRKSINPLLHLRYFANFQADVKRIRKIIREENIDIVQVCGLLNIQAGIAARKEKKKVMWQLLSNYAPKAMRMAFSPIVYKLSDAIMSTGMIVANDHPMIPKHRHLSSFFPPVNLEKFATPTEEEIVRSKELLKVGPQHFTIGTIGNFNKQKSHEFLIEVFKAFHDKFPESRLRILGSPNATNVSYYNTEVIGLAKSYNLLDNDVCSFIEVGPKVVDYARGIDVFVLSSQSEGIPTVMLEAMALGKPVISTNVGSIAEIVDDEIGMLVTYKNKDQFVAALTDMYQSPGKRLKMGERAAEKAKSKFNIQNTLKDHLEVFQKL